PTRPIDATLSVTKAARLLGVHPNTVRAWSDAGRLRYYRINPRGDRRYRMGDLQRFLAAAENMPEATLGLQNPPGGHGRRGAALPERLADAPAGSTDRDRVQRRADLATMTALGRVAANPETLDDVLREAILIIRQRGEFRAVAIYELRGERFVPRAAAPTNRLPDLPRSYGALGTAIDRAAAGDLAPVDSDGYSGFGDDPLGTPEVAVAIPGDERPWGALVIVPDPDGDRSALDADLLVEIAGSVGSIVASARRADEVGHRLHRADALRRVASDIGSRLDLDRILSGLVEHAMVLFNGDRAAVVLRGPDRRAAAEVSRGLSQRYLQSVAEFPARSLPT